MEKITITALSAGEQRGFAPALPASPRPVARRDIMSAVKRARKSYGLSTSDVFVLDTLLSFLPCRDKATGIDRPVSSDMVLIIYASNETVCARANGMDPRVLRRHLENLRGAGLIGRKDSATGKRFPLRSGGRVRDAFGVDLAPLLRAYPQVAVEAGRLECEAAEIRSMRAEALALRAELLRSSDQLTEETLGFIQQVKTILRRAKLTLAQIAYLIQEMAAVARGQSVPQDQAEMIETPCPTPDSSTSYSAGATIEDGEATELPDDLSKFDAVETSKESAGNGLIVRQVESIKIDLNKEGETEYSRLRKTWAACPNVASFCPDAMKSPSQMREAVFVFGSCLSLKKDALASAVARIGWIDLLKALEYLAENAGRIKSPPAYFKKMIEDVVAGRQATGIQRRSGGAQAV